MRPEGIFRTLEVKWLRIRLGHAISEGNPGQVALLSDRLGHDQRITGMDLIDAYGNLAAKAKRNGDYRQVEEIQKAIHATQKDAFSPKLS